MGDFGGICIGTDRCEVCGQEKESETVRRGGKMKTREIESKDVEIGEVFYTLVCGRCGEAVVGALDKETVVRNARKFGWKVLKEGDEEKVICSICLKDIKSKKRREEIGILDEDAGIYDD